MRLKCCESVSGSDAGQFRPNENQAEPDANRVARRLTQVRYSDSPQLVPMIPATQMRAFDPRSNDRQSTVAMMMIGAIIHRHLGGAGT
jgi:hypothetical protein